MENYNFNLVRNRRPRFEELPAENRRRVFNVDYAWVRGMQGGEFFFTRTGWAIAEALLPQYWYDRDLFAQIGQALSGGTGTVYHVPLQHPRRPDFGLVVKFCRFAQGVPLTLVGEGAGFDWSGELLRGAEFPDPFTEFGNLFELRRRAKGRVRTKHPLAIYCPAAHYPAWQLGRDSSCRWQLDYDLADDQKVIQSIPKTKLEWERVYILIYQWINGVDLGQAHRDGIVDAQTVETITRKAAHEVYESGFAVLDHKPSHIIVRQEMNGQWMKHHGELVWALVDYELLIRRRGVPSLASLPI